MIFNQDAMQAFVSTHAPRMGSDPVWAALNATMLAFQPTPPAWGAT